MAFVWSVPLTDCRDDFLSRPNDFYNFLDLVRCKFWRYKIHPEEKKLLSHLDQIEYFHAACAWWDNIQNEIIYRLYLIKSRSVEMKYHPDKINFPFYNATSRLQFVCRRVHGILYLHPSSECKHCNNVDFQCSEQSKCSKFNSLYIDVVVRWPLLLAKNN